MATRKRVVEATRKRQAPQVRAIKALVLPDEDPDTSWMDDPEHTDRREAYENGDFVFIGVRAEAEIVVDGVIQHITSGGLWGTESDSGEEYIRVIAAEEYADLRKILTSIGVPTSQLPTEFDPKWVEWRV